MPDDHRLAEAILDLLVAGYSIEYVPDPRGYFDGTVTVARDDGDRRVSHRLPISPTVRTAMDPTGALVVDLGYARHRIDEEVADAMD